MILWLILKLNSSGVGYSDNQWTVRPTEWEPEIRECAFALQCLTKEVAEEQVLEHIFYALQPFNSAK